VDPRIKEHTPISSLLIRGSPGAGKTLMALSLASSHQGDFFYVSTRISPEEVFKTYPWLREEMEKLKILDASRDLKIVDATRKIFEREENISSLIFSMKYEDKPSFLKSLLSLMRGAENPLVVIDSLEAVQEYIGKEILRDLLEASSELNFKLILVVERDGIGKEDYLVDGVVELRRRIIDEAVVRRMIVHKLRGGNIPQPCYLFTLRDGRFRMFEPFSYEPSENPKLFEPIEDPDENRFSSGSRSLDEIFGGGFPKGSTILLEVGKGVTREMFHRFLATFTLNFLRKGKRVYNIPTLGTDTKNVDNRLKPFLRENEIKNFVWIERGGIWGRERLRGEEAVEEAERTYEIVYGERRGSYEDLHVSGVDALYSRYGDEVVRVLEEGNLFAQDTRGLFIRIAKPGFPFMEELSNLSDVHIKMENVCGVPVIRGLKPKTQYYAMVVDISRGYPRAEFEKIE